MLANLRRNPDAELSISRYRALAAKYDASCKHIAGARAAAIEALQLSDGHVVIDVACGTGATLCALAERVGLTGRVIGVEHSPNMAAMARERIAAAHLADRVTLIESEVEAVDMPSVADAILLCYTHDVLQSPDALENIFRHVAPGGRVAVVGSRLQSWWCAAPVNLWVCLRGWRYLTTFRGLRHPWRPLLAYCPDLHVTKTFHIGTSYLACGTYRPDQGERDRPR